jgi:hypothetical protein
MIIAGFSGQLHQEELLVSCTALNSAKRYHQQHKYETDPSQFQHLHVPTCDINFHLNYKSAFYIQHRT